ncbi:hypothetical protein PV08_07500 [Exophiala spinifera]|uniref:Rad4 beta-hairpin domain-containing protein n=1 Tax=Exophiala spinifera TaxID=91928 RepID=A0A0D1YIF4_9EURO|nr:uncharacterized protein PV08_07500 [Exophiala spinifera]KIW14716.1 hypothetical protein PV08_07500 [Exophiala spinifera]
MPPRKRQTASRTTTRKTRQSARHNSDASDDGIPAVYGEMLAEAAREEQTRSLSSRPSKRRKLSEEPSSGIGLDFNLFGPDDNVADANVAANNVPENLQQTVYDEFEGSEESDVEFEDVDLDAPPEEPDVGAHSRQSRFELDLSKTNLDAPRRTTPRRKPVSPAERKLRLEVHKAHLLCLLGHLSCRNRWCESPSVQSILKPLVPKKVTSLLHVDDSKPQYQRNHSFMKGIEEVCALWKLQWEVTVRGMRRAHWKDDVDVLKESDDAEDLIDFDDFRAAAHSRSGSRDLGAQLCCALLRSIAVDARLVCSLQVLPFSGVAKGQSTMKPKPQYYHAPAQDYTSMGGTTTIMQSERSISPKKKKKIVDSPYPIFWVEAYSPSIATWIPLDPLVRGTINKPKRGFEPPASDQLNNMTYVIAFEDDGSAKDVTRRYTEWYHAKTRKQRVESTKGGEEWWDRTMRTFRKPFEEDRDVIEDVFLNKRTQNEPMPRNVQDFKGHPVYVLERHLRMNEVIHPKHEVGKVSAGPSKNAKLESVYRRRDVHLCRTADAWYRRGKDVNEGEQPLKRVLSKKRHNHPLAEPGEDLDDGADADGRQEGAPLYADYQTSFYQPPPVVDGKVPKNGYGNLDVYVPTMIPAGAVHIRHPLAAQSARVLGIDYADAVTGFEFKGRQGTAVIDGVVVSLDMTSAVISVIEGLESQASDEAEAERSRVVLGLWKRWLQALRVRERVHRDYGNSDEESGDKADEYDDEDYEEKTEDDGGGFVPEAAEQGQPSAKFPGADTEAVLARLKPIDQLLPPEVIHQDIVIVRSPHKMASPWSEERGNQSRSNAISLSRGEYEGDDGDEGQGGGFIVEDEDGANGTESLFEDDDANSGGGFILEDEGELNEGTNTNPQMTLGQPQLHKRRPTPDANASENGGGFLHGDEKDTDPTLPYHVVSMDSRQEIHRKTEFQQDTTGSQQESPVSPSGTATADAADPSMNNTTAEPLREKPEAETEPKALPNPEILDPEVGTKRIETDSNNSPLSQTSLLSHDPDEEDAEPDWIVDSLG